MFISKLLDQNRQQVSDIFFL